MNRAAGDDAAAQPPPKQAPQASTPAAAPTAAAARHVIIIGFGLSGRAVVNTVIEQGVSYTVIERNEQVVDRCRPGGLHIIRGDAREGDVLRQAGIERATEVTVTVPNDAEAFAIVEQARKLTPTARIIARCTFVSGGIEAARRGASDTVIAEQVVAAEFARVMAVDLQK
jgi:monovalent cation:H+ antiporter-2, CPA2 family